MEYGVQKTITVKIILSQILKLIEERKLTRGRHKEWDEHAFYHFRPIPLIQHNARQGKTRQGKTRQRKTIKSCSKIRIKSRSFLTNILF